MKCLFVAHFWVYVDFIIGFNSESRKWKCKLTKSTAKIGSTNITKYILYNNYALSSESEYMYQVNCFRIYNLMFQTYLLPNCIKKKEKNKQTKKKKLLIKTDT